MLHKLVLELIIIVPKLFKHWILIDVCGLDIMLQKAICHNVTIG